MLKKYILIASVAFTCALNAQTPTVYPGMPQKTTDPKQQKPVYSGPSAAGDMKRDNGDFAGAIVEYNKEITKIDADAQRIAKLKTDYEKMSEFDKMNQNQDEATKNYPDWAKLYYGRAMANIGLGKKMDAKPDLDLAITLDNTMADAYYQRAMIINAPDNKDAACMDMTKAASLGSEKAKIAFDDNFCWNDAMQHAKSGQSDLSLRKYADAISEYTKAIDLCPDSGVYYAKRGEAYLGNNDKKSALEDFNKATQLSPNSPDGFYQLGLYYFNDDDFDKAFDNLTKAINLDPMNYDAYMYRAQCCERQQKFTSANYDYGQAISLRPSDPEAYYRRALIERDQKDMVNACKDFHKASALGNTDATAYLSECK